jgi:ATP/maltotriose-dependent transcriptional regulator MalT
VNSAPIETVEAHTVLVGREEELHRLEGLLQAASTGRSGSLIVCGDPGIGKTALLHQAVRAAQGGTVLRAEGVEAESELPFAGLSQLLQPLLPQLGSLPPPQAAALSAALALGPPAPGDPFTVSVATLSLLAAGSGEYGLLALVDDAHAFDTASLEALVFAARRLGAEGVVMLFATRPRIPTALARSGLPRLDLAPLGAAEAASVLARAPHPLAPSVASAIAATASGNPLALVEIPKLLSKAQATGHQPLPDPLPSSEGIQGAFGQQLARLQGDARLAVTVAAACDAETFTSVEGALDLVGVRHEALEEAEAAGLLTLGGGVRFRHPLMRSAAYWSATDAERRNAHRMLADAVPEQGSPLSRAWHLALAVPGPDDAVASALEKGAADAASRGAPSSAGRALVHAARLTSQPEERARRLVAAAENLQLVGQLPEAFALLDEASPTAADARLRATASLVRGRGLQWVGSPPEAHVLMAEAADQLEGVDPATRALISAESVYPLMLSAQPKRCLAVAQKARAIADEVGGPPLAVASVVLAEALVLVGQAKRAGAILSEVRPAIEAASPMATTQYLQVKASFLAVLGEYDASRLILDQLISRGRRGSAPGVLPYSLASLAYIDQRTGHWTRAYAEATEAVELGRETGQVNFLGFALCALAQVEAGLGRGDACRRHTDEALEIAQRLGGETLLIYIGAARLLAALGEGAAEEAIAAGEPVAQLFDERGYAEPALAQWHGDLIEAYVRAGRRAPAERLLETLGELARRTGGAWALGVAARCQALLADDRAFEDHYAEAMSQLGRTSAPFERARTELSLGERRRRAGRRAYARAPIRSALQTFQRLDARPWADRARSELRACGGQSREPVSAATEGLTPHELQVALVVARGATNREAAAALFVSPKTIDFHLRNVYRKLGVRSRTELAHALAGVA